MSEPAEGGAKVTIEPVPWHARLPVRLTVFLILAQLAFLWLTPRLYRWSLEVLGLPSDDSEIVMPHDLDGSAPGGAALYGRTESIYVAERLLKDAQRKEDGHWVPTPEARQAIEDELTPRGQGFAWLRADRTIVALSGNQPWSVGDVLAFPFRGEEPAIAHEFRGFWVGSVFAPVHLEGSLAGWLVLLHAENGRADSAADVARSGAHSEGTLPRRAEPIELDEQELRFAEGRKVVLSRVVLFASVGLLAVSASLLVSRLVTRRLSRLARDLTVPFEDRDELPGPFDDAGRDEFAVLARSLNLGRERVLTLIDELGRRGDSHRRWVAQVSHDLRTPLTALIATLDRADATIARAKMALGDPDRLADPAALCETVGELLHVMRIDAERVNDLADDLLDLARLEAGDLLQREPVPPGELLRQARTEFGPMAQKKEIALESRATPELPILAADGHLLLRALENLVRNALRHARSYVRLEASRIDGAIRFEVRDDGSGFPVGVDGTVRIEDLLNRRQQAGSGGLGLVVVQRVAELHGGRVAIENAAEGGAVVSFEIPVEDSEGDSQEMLARWSPRRRTRSPAEGDAGGRPSSG